MEIQPGYAPALRQLAINAIRTGDNTAALNYFEQALAANPDHSDLKIDFGNYLIRLQQFPKAEKLLREAQKKSQNKAKSTLALAQLYLQQGKPSLAISELNLFSSEAQTPEMLAELGNARMMQGDFASALSSYNQLLTKTNSPAAFFLQHAALRALSQPEKALKSLGEALRVNPEFLPALVGSAEIALEQKDITKAQPFLEKAAALEPENSVVLALQGESALQAKNYSAAVSLLQKSFSLQPSSLIAQKTTQAYLANNDAKGAILFLKEGVKKYPDNAQLHFYLAGLLLDSGDIQDAIDAYEKSLNLYPDNAIALNNLAWLIKDNDTERAKRLAEKAVALAPENSSIKDTLNVINLLK